MKKKNFTFTTIEDISTLEIVFSGELKGLEDFETDDFLKLAKKIKTEAESKLIYLNLTRVQFWDTEGMRQTLVLANDINIKIGGFHRVTIVAPRDGYLYKRAVEKYRSIVDQTVSWKSIKPVEAV